MKRKALLSVLVIGLIAALIGGATMAWFTDDAEVASAEFTAGTLIVNVDEESPLILTPENKYFDNVNPGDCATITWNIVNEGTKAAEFRVKLDMAWSNDLGIGNVYYSPLPDSGWTMYEDMNGLWLYYTGGPVAGTYNPAGGDPLPATVVPLTLVIGFDGEATTNDYQGQTFTIGGQVNAVQASNNAPVTVWGDGWTIANEAEGFYVNDGLAATFAGYFLDGPGANMPCWKGEETPQDPNQYDVSATIQAEGSGSVDGVGTFEENDPVTLTATAEEGFIFSSWTLPEGLILTSGTANDATISFDMPADDVAVTANFTAVSAPDPVIASFDLSGISAQKSPHPQNHTKVNGNIINLKYDNGNMVSGDVAVTIRVSEFFPGFGYVVKETTTTLTFTNGNATIINVQVDGVKTNNNNAVSVIINGIVRPMPPV